MTHKPWPKRAASWAGVVTLGAAALAVLWRALTFLLATEFVTPAQARQAHAEMDSRTGSQLDALRTENAEAHRAMQETLGALLKAQLERRR